MKKIKEIKRIKCFFGKHSFDYDNSFMTTRVKSVSILDDNCRVRGELIRHISCTEGKCKYCNKVLKVECDTTDIPIGI